LAGSCVLGRNPDCDVVLMDGKASREHCRLVQEDERWFVEDLGSANGTRLNGTRIEERRELHHGDRIGVSTVVIAFIDPGPGHSAVLDLADWDRGSLVGRLIGGYRIQEVLGSGTLATVFRARQLNLDRTVALKIFHPTLLAENPDIGHEIARHTRQAGRVTDPGIAAIHECGTDDGLLWYSMEFVDGDQVSALLDRDERLEWDLATVITERVARALSKAHAQGLVHQGITPKNVMLSSNGHVKLLELALAPLLHQQQHRFKAERSQHHIAPEQLQGQDPVPASDCYALGCLLFHLATGRPPYAGAEDVAAAHIEAPIPRLRRLCDSCPEDLDRLVTALLDKDPERRLGDATELADQLRAIRHSHAGSDDTRRKDSDIQQTERLAQVEHRVHRDRTGARNRNGSYGIIFMLIAGFVLLLAWLALRADRTPTPSTPMARSEDPRSAVRRVPARDQDEPSRPGATDPVIGPTTPPTEPVLDSAAWQDLVGRVSALTGSQRWAEAERAVLRYLQGHPEGPDADAASALLQQVRLDGRLWYDVLARDLPTAAETDDLRGLVDRLQGLRRQVLPSLLPDVGARLRAAETRLRRGLAVARRRATQLLEAGQAADLPALAAEIAVTYTGTRLEHLQRTFSARCTEAARIPWLGDWNATRAELVESDGPAALAAAGALFLTGDAEAATTLLLRLDDPGLRARADAMIGHSGLTITFDDLAALERFTVTAGDPALADGALIGVDGQTTELISREALRGRAWESRATFSLPLDEDAELTLGLGRDESFPIEVRFNVEGMQVVLAGPDADRTSTNDLPEQPIDLLVRNDDGAVRVLVNGTEVASAAVDLLPAMHVR
ncbi:MAG: protein kinase domain-containing protein, partial [Planctomycetota bacterium]